MKALLVEDHAMFRAMVKMILTDRIGFVTVQEASDCRTARRAFAASAFDLIVCDVDLDDGDGVDLACDFGTSDPRVRILIVSSHTDDVTLGRVFNSPVVGFVDKVSENVDGLERALRAILSWKTYFSSSVWTRHTVIRTSAAHFSHVLSDREIELMPYFGLGMPNDAIAEQLGLASGTVQTHRRNIMKKLDLRNQSQFVRYCLLNGFTRTSSLRRLT